MANEEMRKLAAAVNQDAVITDYSSRSHAAAYIGYEKDVLSQFKANLKQVEESHARLRYVLNEVNTLIKK